MPELHDLTEIARHAGDAASPPAYETLLGKARVRRRRRRVAATVASAAVVAAVAGGIAVSRPDASTTPPTPASPGPSTSVAPAEVPTKKYGLTADRVVAKGDLYNYAVDGEGDLLGDWKYCRDSSRCLFAWHLVRTDGTTESGIIPGTDAVRVDGGADYFTADSPDAAPILIRRDGTAVRLRPARDGDLAPGAAEVGVGGRSYLVDPGRATYLTATPPGDNGADTLMVGPDGTAWATDNPRNGGPAAITWGTPGGTWSKRTFHGSDGTAAFVVSGQRVAAYALELSSDQPLQAVGAAMVTTDGGHTWTDLDPSDLPFTHVESLATSADGALFVSDGEHVYRSTDGSWTTVARVTGANNLSRLEGGDATHPDTVYGYSYDQDRLYAIAAGGRVSAAPRQLR